MPGMDADLLDLARTVDLTVLGARVKAARVAQRLTQTEVAGAEMSTAYVSRIESGQRRPDPELLAVIASRVGVGLDELVMGTTRDKVAEARLSLVSAEMELKTGNARAALSQVDETLMDLAGQSQGDLQREALRLKAAALEATGRLDQAIVLLENLTDEAERDTLWLRDMTMLGRCYRVSGDLDLAVTTGESALRTTRQYEMTGTYEGSAAALSLAASYFERGDTGAAVRLCHRAIEEAEASDSRARGATYWAASIIESRRGNHVAALRLGYKAMATIELSENHAQIVNMKTQLGVLHLRGDSPDPESALVALESAADEMAVTDLGPSARAANLAAQARAHLFLGARTKARDLANQALMIDGVNAPLVRADALVLLGQVALLDGEPTAALRSYADAVTTLSAVGADRSAAQLWFELGENFAALDRSTDAADAFRRSAASTGVTALTGRMPSVRLGDVASARAHNA